MNSTGTEINKITSFVEKHYRLLLFTIVCLSIFNIFYKINVSNTEFDEARHGISAYEMLKNHDFIVNTYAYKTDYWNLKPPMSFWMIMLGYKLLGFNMLGLRFFSGLSALATILAVALFVKYKHGKLASLISSLVLGTSAQYILYHSARNAEADASYVLFFTLSILSIMMLNGGKKYLYLSSFFAALAFLTKSWHVLPILGILGIYLLGRLLLLRLRLREWLLLVLSFFIPVWLWMFMRIQKDGLIFLKDMVQYDLISRSSRTLEGHVGGADYYLSALLKFSGVWVILLLFCVFTYTMFYRHNLKKLRSGYSLALFLWLMIPLVLYSTSRTKIDWYLLPIYPPLAILCGAAFSKTFKEINIRRFVSIILAVEIISGAVGYESLIYWQLSSVKNDSVELALREMGSAHKYSGYSAYTASGTFARAGTWQQTHLFSAELWCDFKTVNGGLPAFLNNHSGKALLLIPSDEAAAAYIRQYNLKVVQLENGYYLLSH